MRSSWSHTLVLASVSALAVCALAASAGTAARATSAATGLVPKVGTGGPQTGDFTPSGEGAAVDEEFPGEPEDEEGGEGPEPFDGQLPGGVSLSKGSGKGTAVSTTAKAKSQPEFQSEFEGLNLFQQRYARHLLDDDVVGLALRHIELGTYGSCDNCGQPIGKGRLRSLPLDPDVVLDLVPADMVVNTILAAIPKLAQDGRGSLQVYQVATGSRNPITMGRLHELIVGYFEANPMLDKRGEPIQVRPLTFPSPEAFRRRYKLKAAPLSAAESALERMADWGVLADRAQKQRRKLAATRAALDKLFYYGELYEPYLNLDCRFEVDNTMGLFEWLTPEERRRFNFDVSRINWRHYIHVHIAGIKKYILKVERAGTLEVEEDVSAEREAVRTINDLLRHGSERYPDRVALQVQRDGGWVRYTYADLRDAARRVGDRFHRLGYAKGDRVVLWSENQPEWGVAYMGAAAIGLVVVPLDSRTWHREVWSVAGFTGARAILASRACFARLTDEELAGNERAEGPVALLDVDSECEPFARAQYPRSTDPAPAADPAGGFDPPAPDDLASITFA